MSTCGNCAHYDRARTSSYGMAPCTKEPGLYRIARHFSPAARCNKNGFQSIPKAATP